MRRAPFIGQDWQILAILDVLHDASQVAWRLLSSRALVPGRPNLPLASAVRVETIRSEHAVCQSSYLRMSVCHNAAKVAGIRGLFATYWSTSFELHPVLRLRLLPWPSELRTIRMCICASAQQSLARPAYSSFGFANWLRNLPQAAS